jgi:hypothetical protein
VHDHRKRIDRLVVDQDAHLDEIALAQADLLIVEAGIAAADRLQPIIEIEHHLVQRQLVIHLRAPAHIGEAGLDAAPVLTQLQDAAQIFVGRVDGGLDPRLVDLLDAAGIG